jgi:hypothetical protein
MQQATKSTRTIHTAGGSLWTNWLAVNAAACMVGVGSAVAVSLWFHARRFEAHVGLFWESMVLFAVAILQGIMLGYAQWVVLRHIWRDLNARNWMLATTIGALAGWSVGGISSGMEIWGHLPPDRAETLLVSSLLGLALGIIVAVPQSIVLRRHAGRRSAWWIPANALAWAGAAVAFITAVDRPLHLSFSGVALLFLAACAIAGTAAAVVQGGFLFRKIA